MLGLRRLGLDAVWLELSSGHRERPGRTKRASANSSGSCASMGWLGAPVSFIKTPADDARDLAGMRCVGMARRELRERLAGPNTLLNLSYSLHPPLLLEFERRVFCDLDPSEIFFWMTKMEMGQSHHHEFWTIGLNVHGDELPVAYHPSALAWHTFYPLADTALLQPASPPEHGSKNSRRSDSGTWGGGVEVVDGESFLISRRSLPSNRTWTCRAVSRTLVSSSP